MAALRAIDVLPRRVPVERVARYIEGHVLWQRHRQMLLGHRHHTTDFAVDERDGRAPIALARNAPIAQTPHGLAFTEAACLHAFNHRSLGAGNTHTIEEAGVHQNPVTCFGFLAEGLVGIGGVARNHTQDRQAIFGGKVEVALVVPWHGHDCAGAIFHQHEVGDVDRQIGPGERVLGGDAGIEAQFFSGFQFGCGGPALLAQRDEVLCRLIAHGSGLRHGVICRHGHKACAKDRVGPGGIDFQFLAA